MDLLEPLPEDIAGILGLRPFALPYTLDREDIEF